VKVLLFGSALFALAFLAHIILWKVRLPRRQIKAILQIFFGTLLLGLVFLHYASPSFGLLGQAAPEKLFEYMHICLYFVSLTLAYMITYTGIEADSPSLVMVMRIAGAGRDGLVREDFERAMSDELLVIPRVRDLVLDKMVRLEGDKYLLTPKGILFARIFIFYRALLNAPKGG
jgi:hypothetical protein